MPNSANQIGNPSAKNLMTSAGKLGLAVVLGLSALQTQAVTAPDDGGKSKNLQASEGRRQFEIWEREYAKKTDSKPPNMEKALRALKRSAELEDPEGLEDWALYFNWPDLWPDKPEQYAYRFRLLKRAVELGNVDANVGLGLAYGFGQGVARDPGMYAYHQCVAKRAGNESARRNLEFSTAGEHAEFARISLQEPVLFRVRADKKAGGITYLRVGQEAWEVADYNDGWTAVYLPEGCVVGFVETIDLKKARAAPTGD
ncbi:sel1 repeat family protein [Thermomonas sp. HDW16]|uniref:sel1 repeat family protein n=1 Tax=Thermomonas sp. HDW16 TaxID=2714945 RepID=UPI00140BB8F9|nr:sel1 repeat family protein [Thermomonas sp. HDW16]QIL20173.1 sel1 repeat family protein [Thermomonas sp. HDW16]